MNHTTIKQKTAHIAIHLKFDTKALNETHKASNNSQVMCFNGTTSRREISFRPTTRTIQLVTPFQTEFEGFLFLSFFVNLLLL